MRIFFIVPYAPTPIRVRPYNLIKSLAARGHSVTLATLCSSPDEQWSLARLEALGVRVIARPLARWRSLLNCAGALPTPLPLQVLRAEIEAALDSESTNPDLVGRTDAKGLFVAWLHRLL